ncbi:RNase adapter RapZ [Sessilibacter sp. MAH2]
MELVIVSGRSGSGISSALRALEDAGMICIDNFPITLLKYLVTSQTDQSKQFAVSIDARSNLQELEAFDSLFPQLESLCRKTQIIFLDARDDVLIQRFSETRRKHPLTSDNVDLKDAILAESELLRPIQTRASRVIDTSNLSVHDLRNLVHKWVTGSGAPHMAVQFQSFGFKRGLPADADLVFDVRCLPNPFWIPKLRGCTGNDPEVVQFLKSQSMVHAMIDSTQNFLKQWLPEYEKSNRSYITIAIGCTGGQHRSVYVCNALADQLKEDFENILVRHRDLAVPNRSKTS